MRLIDADELNEYIGRESLDTREKIFALVDRMPTLPNPCGKPCAFERPHGEWTKESAIDYLTEIGWLPEHDRILTDRPHGEWQGEPKRRKMVTRICTSCGDYSVVGYFCMWCGADMRKEGEAREE